MYIIGNFEGFFMHEMKFFKSGFFQKSKILHIELNHKNASSSAIYEHACQPVCVW